MQELNRNTHHFFYTLLAFPRAWRFIRYYKLWAGLKEYKWVFRFLIIVAGLAGLYLLAEYNDWANEHTNDSIMSFFVGSDSLVSTIGRDTYDSLTDGALKWIILILLEVVIYHFMRSTLKIQLGKDMPDAHNFKPFLEAQKRMIKVSAVAYLIEALMVNGLLDTIFVLLPFIGWLEPVLVLSLQSGLLGFAIIDNYNEQFNLEISQSLRYAFQKYLGVMLGLGLPLFLILQVPFFGAIFGPVLAAVTAGIVMKELGDLHTIGYIPSQSELKKVKKRKLKKA